MKAWHFINKNWTTAYGNLPVSVGVPLIHEGDIIPCKSGLHASVRAIDALRYASDTLVTLVECEGEIVEHGGDKIVCRKRTVIWGYDAESVLRAFARRCALSVIDKWDAPAVVREYLETGNEDLRAAAESAAGSAAWSAAGRAAWSAARSAAGYAVDAARGAAGRAAWSAAGSAAGSAAESAAESAAYSAAESAAWRAARDQQNEWLEQMLTDGLPVTK